MSFKLTDKYFKGQSMTYDFGMLEQVKRWKSSQTDRDANAEMSQRDRFNKMTRETEQRLNQ